MSVDLIAVGSLVASAASAVAAIFAWCTAKASLKLSKAADERMQHDALRNAKERYAVLTTAVRMRKATLSAMSNDTESALRSGAAISGHIGSSRLKLKLDEVDEQRKIVSEAESLIGSIKEEALEADSFAQFSSANSKLSSMQVALEAAIDRMDHLRSQAQSMAKPTADS